MGRPAVLTLSAMAGVVLSTGCGGFGPLSEYVVEKNPRGLDAMTASAVPAEALRLTYLGTQGYLLESGETCLLIDPFLSRPAFWRVAVDAPIAPQADRLEKFLARLHRPPQVILITHGHYDHLLDAPEIARRTSAVIAGSVTSVRLAQAAGVPDNQVRMIQVGEVLNVGTARVRVLPARHDRLCCSEPFPGEAKESPPEPVRPSDWKLGEPFGFLIELAGRRIYVDSGGRTPMRWPDDLGPVDLAIAGAALPDSRERLPDLLERLKPGIFLPGHQDDFFRPLEQGFYYGAFTDPAAVKRAVRAFPKTRMIVLDYFSPWLVP